MHCLRSVADSTRMLPYHVAWGRGFRLAAGLLNPTVNIDAALETARELEEGAPAGPGALLRVRGLV